MRKEHGLLFKAEMIRALLNTREDVWPPQAIDPALPFKGQTRRLIEPQPTPEFGFGDKITPHFYEPALEDKRTGEIYPGKEVFGFANEDSGWVCPHLVGTLIYAKETHKITVRSTIIFAADKPQDRAGEVDRAFGPWKPSIFMRKEYARLWFEVKEVRVERVNAISEADAMAEGIIKETVTLGRKRGDPDYDVFALKPGNHCDWEMSAKAVYKKLWDSINGKGDFDKGNWVWAYSLRRLSEKELARLRAQE